MGKPPLARIPLRTCLVCGGNWFREGDFYEFLREEAVGSFWPTWPELVGQKSPGPMTLGICLCGSPWTPLLGGVRWGRTPNQLVHNLMKSLEGALEANDDAALSAATEEWARQDAYAVLRRRVKVVERAIARRRRPGPGRPWALPKRPADARGRDQLVLAVEQRGFTARQAKKAVAAFWKAMAKGVVEDKFLLTPIGVFTVERRQRLRRQRFGHIQVLYRLPRIVFRPDKRLVHVLNYPVNNYDVEETRVPTVNHAKDQLCCEICGSVEFLEAEFKQYRKMSSSLPGGDLSPVTENGIRVQICLCGNPIDPGHLRRRSIQRADWESFRQSFAAARRRRQSVQARIIEQLQSEALATKQDHDRLAEEVAKLEAIIRELPGNSSSSNKQSS